MTVLLLLLETRRFRDLFLRNRNTFSSSILIPIADNDGNGALAEAIKQTIKNQVELLEDMFD